MKSTPKHSDIFGHPINVGDTIMLVGDPNRVVEFSTVLKLNPKKVRIRAHRWNGTVSHRDVGPKRIIVIHDEFLHNLMLLKLQNKLPMA